jgi:hypothetical protein
MGELNTLLFTAILWIQECQLMLQIITTPSSVVRIQKARTALLLDHPFFGTLLFRLGARACRSIATMGDRSEPREGNARALRFIRIDAQSISRHGTGAKSPRWVNLISRVCMAGCLPSGVRRLHVPVHSHMGISYIPTLGEKNQIGPTVPNAMLHSAFTLSSDRQHGPRGLRFTQTCVWKSANAMFATPNLQFGNRRT